MTARLSSQREAEVVARSEAATPGPWMVEEDRERLHRYVCDELGLVAIDFGYVGNRTQDDAEFVAHAREDVAVLLAELAAVRAERDEALAAVERLKGQRSFLLKQIQKKGARSGDADAALRSFLSGEDEEARS